MASQCPLKKLVVIDIFQENQLKDKYVTNKMEKKCNEKKDIVIFLSNNLKVRGIMSINLAIDIRKLI